MEVVVLEPIIEVKRVKKYFAIKEGFHTSYLHAVDGVTFSIGEGETLGLVGESGCGKSTFGRILLMLTPPSEGSIKFCGEELTKMNESKLLKKHSEFQMIFQDPFASLNPRHTVRTILEEPVIIHKIITVEKGPVGICEAAYEQRRH